MVDNWISQIIVNAVSQPVANAVATAGSYAGGAIGGVGEAINGVGRGIETRIRHYGDGVKDYGNAVQDWTRAGGPRVSTASNPLGLPGSALSGKLAFTGAGATRPAQKAIKGPSPQPKLPAPTKQKALPSSKPSTSSAKPAGPAKTPTKAAPKAPAKTAVKTPAKTSTQTPNKPAASTPIKPKAPTTNGTNSTKPVSSAPKKVTISAESRPERKTVKPRPSAPKSSYGADSEAARNPLGL